MGNNVVKFVIRELKRPFREFNIENRAHKVISKDKPLAAPKYHKDETEYERMMREYPDVYEENLKKHAVLDKHLRDVYVKSYDPFKTKFEADPNRPLPSNRQPVDDFEYGMKEPEKITLGKTTLRKALQFITDHQARPKVETAQKIAIDYNLPEETVRNVLKYFKVYEFYIPQNYQTKATFAGPGAPRVRIVKETRKQLDSGQKDK